MRSRRSLVAVPVIVAALTASCSLVAPAHGAPPAEAAAATAAASWIADQQQPDGGFDVSGFQGFETPDAVLAIAEAAQTGPTWSTAAALAAIEALEYGGSGGPNPLDAVDDWVVDAHSGAGVNAGEASKILLFVVGPLGLDPTDFGASHTDLSSLVYPLGCAQPPETTGIFFYEKMFVGLG